MPCRKVMVTQKSMSQCSECDILGVGLGHGRVTLLLRSEPLRTKFVTRFLDLPLDLRMHLFPQLAVPRNAGGNQTHTTILRMAPLGIAAGARA
jgi:hypothetical protein